LVYCLYGKWKEVKALHLLIAENVNFGLFDLFRIDWSLRIGCQRRLFRFLTLFDRRVEYRYVGLSICPQRLPNFQAVAQFQVVEVGRLETLEYGHEQVDEELYGGYRMQIDRLFLLFHRLEAALVELLRCELECEKRL